MGKFRSLCNFYFFWGLADLFSFLVIFLIYFCCIYGDFLFVKRKNLGRILVTNLFRRIFFIFFCISLFVKGLYFQVNIKVQVRYFIDKMFWLDPVFSPKPSLAKNIYFYFLDSAGIYFLVFVEFLDLIWRRWVRRWLDYKGIFIWINFYNFLVEKNFRIDCIFYEKYNIVMTRQEGWKYDLAYENRDWSVHIKRLFYEGYSDIARALEGTKRVIARTLETARRKKLQDFANTFGVFKEPRLPGRPKSKIILASKGLLKRGRPRKDPLYFLEKFQTIEYKEPFKGLYKRDLIKATQKVKRRVGRPRTRYVSPFKRPRGRPKKVKVIKYIGMNNANIKYLE